MTQQADALTHALRYSKRILSRRRYTCAEIEHKLKLRHVPPAIISMVVDELLQCALLNDREYAEAFVALRRHSKPYGKRRMFYELKKKGIPDALSEGFLAQISDEDEYRLAHDLMQRRMKLERGKTRENKHHSDDRCKQRIVRYLLARGFSRPMVVRVIEEYFKKNVSEMRRI